MANTEETLRVCRVVTAATAAKGVSNEVAIGFHELKSPPKLVGFLANDDPGARMYAEWTGKACTKSDIPFELRVVDKNDLRRHIQLANGDPSIVGIMVYYPVFDAYQDSLIKRTVSSSKDVEGLSCDFMLNMVKRSPLTESVTKRSILPTTPLAMVEILRYLKVYDHSLDNKHGLSGKVITVINRSDVVGKPLAALLAHDGALVYSFDITGIQLFHKDGKSNHLRIVEEQLSLDHCLGRSDIVISGVPGNTFKVPIQALKQGCVCLNFSSEKNFDQDVRSRASIFVPSIGQMTIAVLMRNLLYLAQNKENEKEDSERRTSQTSYHDSKSWFVKFVEIRKIEVSRVWYKPPLADYVRYIVGFVAGLFSLVH